MTVYQSQSGAVSGGYQEPKGIEPAAPRGTLKALLQRADRLSEWAADCGSSLGDLEDKIIGHRQPKEKPPEKNGGPVGPKAIVSGFIDKMDESFDALDNFLDRIKGSLEHLHSKG